MWHRLVDIIRKSSPDVSAEEIADVLWLVARLAQYEEQKEQETKPIASGISDTFNASTPEQPDQKPLVKPETLLVRFRKWVSRLIESIKRYLQPQKPTDHSSEETHITKEKPSSAPAEQERTPLYSGSGDQPGTGASGMPFTTPSAPALPCKLDLARALRPLKRRVKSRIVQVFDEAATVRHSADGGLWLPMLRPANERWFDVVLVVDETATMAVWQETVAELRHVLAHHGAFRDVRVWRMATDSDGKITHLAAGLRSPDRLGQPVPDSDKQMSLCKGAKVQSPDKDCTVSGTSSPSPGMTKVSELLAPGNPRLILVVSDCVSCGWQQGTVKRTLATWAKHHPVTIVQVLPDRLWSRTVLGLAPQVLLHTSSPGSPNTHFRIDAPRLRFGKAKQLLDKAYRHTRLCIPTVTLEPQALVAWARMMTGDATVRLPGFVFDLSEDEKPQNSDTSDDTAASTSPKSSQSDNKTVPPSPLDTPLSHQERLDLFLATASPNARKLAGLLACACGEADTAPLTMDVIRLIQSALLPESKQVHLAEVFLSGLLQQLPATSTNTVRYAFHDGIRSPLQNMVPVPKTIDVLCTVGDYIGRRTGQSFNFRAWLANPTAGNFPIGEALQPFAALSTEVLVGMGGRFAEVGQNYSQSEINVLSEHLDFLASTNPDVYIKTVSNLQVNRYNLLIVQLSLKNFIVSEIKKCNNIFSIAELKNCTEQLPVYRMKPDQIQWVKKISEISDETQKAINARTQQEYESHLEKSRSLVLQLRNSPQNLFDSHDVLVQWSTTLSEPLSYNEAKHLPLYLIPDYLAKKAIYDKEAFLHLVEKDEHLAQQADWAVPRVFPLFVRIETERCTTLTKIADFHTTIQWVNEYLTDEQECAFVATLQRISQQTYEAISTPLPEVQTTETGLGAEVQRAEAYFKRLEQSKIALEQILSDIQSYNRQNKPAARINIPNNWSTILQGQRDNLTRQLDFTRTNINELIERNNRGELPSPYKTGVILEPKSPLFQGRDELFNRLKSILDTPESNQGVLLLGQQRIGKTSLLKQLPVRLGENMLSVYVNMHQASIGDANALIHFLVDKISTDLKTSLIAEQLPPWDRDSIHNDDPYQAFRQWITQVEQVLKHHGCKLLLFLDEFYRIDDAFYASRLDANQLLPLFRDLIVNHPGIAIIFCGTVTLQECHPSWVQVLNALRTVKVTYLPPDAARLVFARPTPDFPPGVYDESAIEYALHITRGHPMMLHALGRAVVEKYNYSRAHATPETPKNRPLPVEEIQSVVENVLTDIDAAFESIFQWAMQISTQQDVARKLLVRLAHDRPINDVGTNEQRTKLLENYCNRDLLEEKSDHPAGYDYQVPLMKEWVRKKYNLMVA